MRAAIAAPPFEHPKLATTAVLNTEGFAAWFEAARARNAKAMVFQKSELEKDEHSLLADKLQ
jgi:hypothetical protein